MIKKIINILLLYTAILPLLYGEKLLGSGTGLRYFADTDSLLSEFYIHAEGDLYHKFSDKMTFFMENELYLVYTPGREVPFYAALGINPDLSYRGGTFLGRWGGSLRLSSPEENGDGIPVLPEPGCWLLLSWGNDEVTFQLKPETTYHPGGRIPWLTSLDFSLSFAPGEQLILTPALTGKLLLAESDPPEIVLEVSTEIDWYPDLPLILHSQLGYEKYFSENDALVIYENQELLIPGYYAYNQLYGKLKGYWLAGSLFNLEFILDVAWKRKEHGMIEAVRIGRENEWLLSLDSKLQLEFPLNETLSLEAGTSVYKVWSNTSYESILEAGGEAGFHIIY